MTANIHQLNELLAGYDRTAEAAELELRLSFSKAVLRELWLKQWTQKELAEKSGLKESYISRVLHSDQNCTFATAGKILHALGVRAGFAAESRAETDVRPQVPRSSVPTDQGPLTIVERAESGEVGWFRSS